MQLMDRRVLRPGTKLDVDSAQTSMNVLRCVKSTVSTINPPSQLIDVGRQQCIRSRSMWLRQRLGFSFAPASHEPRQNSVAVEEGKLF